MDRKCDSGTGKNELVLTKNDRSAKRVSSELETPSPSTAQDEILNNLRSHRSANAPQALDTTSPIVNDDTLPIPSIFNAPLANENPKTTNKARVKTTPKISSTSHSDRNISNVPNANQSSKKSCEPEKNFQAIPKTNSQVSGSLVNQSQLKEGLPSNKVASLRYLKRKFCEDSKTYSSAVLSAILGPSSKNKGPPPSKKHKRLSSSENFQKRRKSGESSDEEVLSLSLDGPFRTQSSEKKKSGRIPKTSTTSVQKKETIKLGSTEKKTGYVVKVKQSIPKSTEATERRSTLLSKSFNKGGENQSSSNPSKNTNCTTTNRKTPFFSFSRNSGNSSVSSEVGSPSSTLKPTSSKGNSTKPAPKSKKESRSDSTKLDSNKASKNPVRTGNYSSEAAGPSSAIRSTTAQSSKGNGTKPAPKSKRETRNSNAFKNPARAPENRSEVAEPFSAIRSTAKFSKRNDKKPATKSNKDPEKDSADIVGTATKNPVRATENYSLEVAGPSSAMRSTTAQFSNLVEIIDLNEQSSSNNTRNQIPKPKKRKRGPVVFPDHIEEIEGDPPSYRCLPCMKTFKTKNNINYHTFCACPPGEAVQKPYTCEICGRGFMNGSHYEYHQKTHTGERPFKCQLCGKSFYSRHKLKRHMLSHTGERPFNCLICEKKFTHSYALKLHMQLHSGDKPFICKICGKGYTTIMNLRRHLGVHTGERNFACSEPGCGRTFQCKHNLDVHWSSVHSGNRPNKCPVPDCTRAFSMAKDLRRHMTTHTGKKDAICPICGTSFARQDNLVRHIKHTHNYADESAKTLVKESVVAFKQLQEVQELAKLQQNANEQNANEGISHERSENSEITNRRNVNREIENTKNGDREIDNENRKIGNRSARNNRIRNRSTRNNGTENRSTQNNGITIRRTGIPEIKDRPRKRKIKNKKSGNRGIENKTRNREIEDKESGNRKIDKRSTRSGGIENRNTRNNGIGNRVINQEIENKSENQEMSNTIIVNERTANEKNSNEMIENEVISGHSSKQILNGQIRSPEIITVPETLPMVPSPVQIKSEDAYVLPNNVVDISENCDRYEYAIDVSTNRIACVDANGLTELRTVNEDEVYDPEAMRKLKKASGGEPSDSSRSRLDITKSNSDLKTANRIPLASEMGIDKRPPTNFESPENSNDDAYFAEKVLKESQVRFIADSNAVESSSIDTASKKVESQDISATLIPYMKSIIDGQEEDDEFIENSDINLKKGNLNENSQLNATEYTLGANQGENEFTHEEIEITERPEIRVEIVSSSTQLIENTTISEPNQSLEDNITADNLNDVLEEPCNSDEIIKSEDDISNDLEFETGNFPGLEKVLRVDATEIQKTETIFKSKLINTAVGQQRHSDKEIIGDNLTTLQLENVLEEDENTLISPNFETGDISEIGTPKEENNCNTGPMKSQIIENGLKINLIENSIASEQNLEKTLDIVNENSFESTKLLFSQDIDEINEEMAKVDEVTQSEVFLEDNSVENELIRDIIEAIENAEAINAAMPSEKESVEKFRTNCELNQALGIQITNGDFKESEIGTALFENNLGEIIETREVVQEENEPVSGCPDLETEEFSESESLNSETNLHISAIDSKVTEMEVQSKLTDNEIVNEGISNADLEEGEILSEEQENSEEIEVTEEVSYKDTNENTIEKDKELNVNQNVLLIENVKPQEVISGGNDLLIKSVLEKKVFHGTELLTIYSEANLKIDLVETQIIAGTFKRMENTFVDGKITDFDLEEGEILSETQDEDSEEIVETSEEISDGDDQLFYDTDFETERCSISELLKNNSEMTLNIHEIENQTQKTIMKSKLIENTFVDDDTDIDLEEGEIFSEKDFNSRGLVETLEKVSKNYELSSGNFQTKCFSATKLKTNSSVTNLKTDAVDIDLEEGEILSENDFSSEENVIETSEEESDENDQVSIDLKTNDYSKTAWLNNSSEKNSEISEIETQTLKIGLKSKLLENTVIDEEISGDIELEKDEISAEKYFNSEDIVETNEKESDGNDQVSIDSDLEKNDYSETAWLNNSSEKNSEIIEIETQTLEIGVKSKLLENTVFDEEISGDIELEKDEISAEKYFNSEDIVETNEKESDGNDQVSIDSDLETKDYSETDLLNNSSDTNSEISEIETQTLEIGVESKLLENAVVNGEISDDIDLEKDEISAEKYFNSDDIIETSEEESDGNDQVSIDSDLETGSYSETEGYSETDSLNNSSETNSEINEIENRSLEIGVKSKLLENADVDEETTDDTHLEEDERLSEEDFDSEENVESAEEVLYEDTNQKYFASSELEEGLSIDISSSLEEDRSMLTWELSMQTELMKMYELNSIGDVEVVETRDIGQKTENDFHYYPSDDMRCVITNGNIAFVAPKEINFSDIFFKLDEQTRVGDLNESVEKAEVILDSNLKETERNSGEEEAQKLPGIINPVGHTDEELIGNAKVGNETQLVEKSTTNDDLDSLQLVPGNELVENENNSAETIETMDDLRVVSDRQLLATPELENEGLFEIEMPRETSETNFSINVLASQTEDTGLLSKQDDTHQQLDEDNDKVKPSQFLKNKPDDQRISEKIIETGAEISDDNQNEESAFIYSQGTEDINDDMAGGEKIAESINFSTGNLKENEFGDDNEADEIPVVENGHKKPIGNDSCERRQSVQEIIDSDLTKSLLGDRTVTDEESYSEETIDTMEDLSGCIDELSHEGALLRLETDFSRTELSKEIPETNSDSNELMREIMEADLKSKRIERCWSNVRQPKSVEGLNELGQEKEFVKSGEIGELREDIPFEMQMSKECSETNGNLMETQIIEPSLGLMATETPFINKLKQSDEDNFMELQLEQEKTNIEKRNHSEETVETIEDMSCDNNQSSVSRESGADGFSKIEVATDSTEKNAIPSQLIEPILESNTTSNVPAFLQKPTEEEMAEDALAVIQLLEGKGDDSEKIFERIEGILEEDNIYSSFENKPEVVNEMANVSSENNITAIVNEITDTWAKSRSFPSIDVLENQEIEEGHLPDLRDCIELSLNMLVGGNIVDSQNNSKEVPIPDTSTDSDTPNQLNEEAVNDSVSKASSNIMVDTNDKPCDTSQENKVCTDYSGYHRSFVARQNREKQRRSLKFQNKQKESSIPEKQRETKDHSDVSKPANGNNMHLSPKRPEPKVNSRPICEFDFSGCYNTSVSRENRYKRACRPEPLRVRSELVLPTLRKNVFSENCPDFEHVSMLASDLSSVQPIVSEINRTSSSSKESADKSSSSRKIVSSEKETSLGSLEKSCEVNQSSLISSSEKETSLGSLENSCEVNQPSLISSFEKEASLGSPENSCEVNQPSLTQQTSSSEKKEMETEEVMASTDNQSNTLPVTIVHPDYASNVQFICPGTSFSCPINPENIFFVTQEDYQMVKSGLPFKEEEFLVLYSNAEVTMDPSDVNTGAPGKLRLLSAVSIGIKIPDKDVPSDQIQFYSVTAVPNQEISATTPSVVHLNHPVMIPSSDIGHRPEDQLRITIAPPNPNKIIRLPVEVTRLGNSVKAESFLRHNQPNIPPDTLNLLADIWSWFLHDEPVAGDHAAQINAESGSNSTPIHSPSTTPLHSDASAHVPNAPTFLEDSTDFNTEGGHLDASGDTITTEDNNLDEDTFS